MTDEIERLKERTSRDDRLSEGDGADEAEDEDDEEIAYASVDEVVLRENAKEGVKTLREQTERDDRLSPDDETEEMDLVRYEDVFDMDDDDAMTLADDPYCGNCEHVTFRRRDGDPSPHCSLFDLKTRLESGMICEDYEPQVSH